MKGVNMAMSVAVSSMIAHAWGVAVISHNIANINTTGFTSRRAVFAAGSGGGTNLYSVDLDPPATPGVAPRLSGAVPAGSTTSPDQVGMREELSSTVDLPREMSRLILAESGFRANAHAFSVEEGLFDCLLDLKV